MQRTPNVNLGSSPARPLPRNDVNVAPGQYDYDKGFGGDVQHNFKIGEKRPDPEPYNNVGPGQYNPDVADTVTKQRTPNINLGSAPARPIPRNDVDVAPGQYDYGKGFGEDVPTFKIGEKRPDPAPYNNVGPGQYNPDVADSVTKQRAPNVNLGSSPARPIPRNDVDVAPGQYDYGKGFGEDVPTFKIGEKRPDPAPYNNVGPGQYNPDVADSVTKQRAPNVNLGSSPARPIPRNDVDVAPGQYDYGKGFGGDSPSFKIGEKRPDPAPYNNVGPGQYNPDVADSLTKQKSPNINLGASPARPIPRNDVNVAPGQYDYGKGFGGDVPGFKIGEKRDNVPV